MRRYAILGWGSLIWDLDNLAGHVQGDWALGAGSLLPMEFTRLSAKRNMALVICLDTVHGVDCSTNVIASRRDAIGGTIEDLAQRERAPEAFIGALCLETGHAQTKRPELLDRVRRWCEATGWTGAVWTDLPSNFEERLGEPFSVKRALTYLRSLSDEVLDEAVRYIERAPPATDTPLRRALGLDPWWVGEAQRLKLK